VQFDAHFGLSSACYGDCKLLKDKGLADFPDVQRNGIVRAILIVSIKSRNIMDFVE
jgi:hypothetical protein